MDGIYEGILDGYFVTFNVNGKPFKAAFPFGVKGIYEVTVKIESYQIVSLVEKSTGKEILDVVTA